MAPQVGTMTPPSWRNATPGAGAIHTINQDGVFQAQGAVARQGRSHRRCPGELRWRSHRPVQIGRMRQLLCCCRIRDNIMWMGFRTYRTTRLHAVLFDHCRRPGYRFRVSGFPDEHLCDRFVGRPDPRIVRMRGSKSLSMLAALADTTYFKGLGMTGHAAYLGLKEIGALRRVKPFCCADRRVPGALLLIIVSFVHVSASATDSTVSWLANGPLEILQVSEHGIRSSLKCYYNVRSTK